MDHPARTADHEARLWCGTADGPLKGLRVVDCGQYLAGPLLGMLLADQGADVIRVDPPGGPRWDSPVNAVLLRGRRTVTLDLTDPAGRRRAQALIHSADVVIENFRPGVVDRLGIGPSTSLEHNPRLVYVSLPGFGSMDPRRDRAAWEGVVMAAAGAYKVPERAAPAFSGLPLGSVFAALEAAVAVVGALIGRERDGLGQRVEMPLFDALFEAGGATPVVERSSEPFRIGDFALAWYRCADGRWIAIGSAWFRHLEWFVRAAGCDAWIDEGLVDYDRMMSDPEAVAEVRRRLVELFATRPAAEWEAIGHAQGCSLIMVRSVSEWLAEPQLLEPGTLVDSEDPELGRIRMPGRAVRISTAPDHAVSPRRQVGADDADLRAVLDELVGRLAGEVFGEVPAPPPAQTSRAAAAAPPLTGRRVLDFTRVAAAPTATKLLAQYGAEVIKVDTDPTGRAMVPEPIGHQIVNRGKRSIRLDLHDPGDREVLDALLQTADTVVQNFTLGVDRGLGIDEPSVRDVVPEVVYVYLNAYGTEGPRAGVRGYADLLNCATGIAERTWGDRPMESGHPLLMVDRPRWPFTDYAAGAVAAFGALLGIYQHLRTGRGSFVTTSLERAATLEQIIYALDYEGRDLPEPRGDAPGWSIRHRLYDTADGAVFVGASESQVDRLLETLGVDDLNNLPAAFAAVPTDEIVAALDAHDIGAHRVERSGILLADDGVAARIGLRVEDSTVANGLVVMAGPVAHLARTPLTPGQPAEPFGAHSDEIRRELSIEPASSG
jgi:crotonobetainyl-CoA:carnitine CoA-transferase CaiB-like acyl-CoA transferase